MYLCVCDLENLLKDTGCWGRQAHVREGDRVQLQHLTNKPDLNGAHGTIMGIKGDRLIVLLEKNGNVNQHPTLSKRANECNLVPHLDH
jgi:hypothetical protein